MLLHQADYFTGIRMATGLELRVHSSSVDDDIENAAGSLFEFRLYPELLFDFGCDTRSLRPVVSCTAIPDQDIHRFTSSSWFVLLLPEFFNRSHQILDVFAPGY